MKIIVDRYPREKFECFFYDKETDNCKLNNEQCTHHPRYSYCESLKESQFNSMSYSGR